MVHKLVALATTPMGTGSAIGISALVEVTVAMSSSQILFKRAFMSVFPVKKVVGFTLR